MKIQRNSLGFLPANPTNGSEKPNGPTSGRKLEQDQAPPLKLRTIFASRVLPTSGERLGGRISGTV